MAPSRVGTGIANRRLNGKNLEYDTRKDFTRVTLPLAVWMVVALVFFSVGWLASSKTTTRVDTAVYEGQMHRLVAEIWAYTVQAAYANSLNDTARFNDAVQNLRSTGSALNQQLVGLLFGRGISGIRGLLDGYKSSGVWTILYGDLCMT